MMNTIAMNNNAVKVKSVIRRKVLVDIRNIKSERPSVVNTGVRYVVR